VKTGKIHGDNASVLSFSHYVPRQELLPEKRMLLDPMLSTVVGSDILESQIRRLQPHLHLFGHTHIPMDLILDNIRYVQWPLGYQREGQMQCKPIFQAGPLLVFNSSLGDGIQGIPTNMPSENTPWSKHYRNPMSRQVEIVDELAPWLQSRVDNIRKSMVTA
jgi:hypothetical protein